MRKIKTVSQVATGVFLLLFISMQTKAQTNIALSATASTSYCSAWESLTAVNNNSSPSSSNDKSTGAYGNWNNPNTIEWVQYDWASSYTISSSEVYWFDDNGGVLTPTTAYVEYWNGTSWINCGTMPKVKNAWNTLAINNVSASKIRLSMLNSSQSTGILEWRVWGSTCSPTAITPYSQINDGSWSQATSVTLNVGDKVKFGPQPSSGGSWNWSGPNAYSATTREITLSNIQSNQAGTYTASYTNSCGAVSTKNFTVTVTDPSTNIALLATASTSFCSSWESLAAINNNSSPTSSNDKSTGAYGNWNNPNTIEWVQYDWAGNYSISKTEVYWFDDAGGVLTPTTAYVEYWNGTSWVNCGTVAKVKNAWNVLNISNVTSNKFRLSMLNTSQSTGILEWRVWGVSVGGSDTQAPTTPGTPTASNITASGCNLAWTASTDNIGVTGYKVYRNGTEIQSVSTTSATVSGLSAGTTYSFTVKAYDAAGNYSASSTARSVTTTSTNTGDPYTWPVYSPNISYNFTDEYPSLTMPTQILNDCPEVVGTQSQDWWTFRWGPNANSLVTSAAITPLLQRMNTDFAYFRDIMGWPPDKRAKSGYKSAVYLYGSGLCTDNASNTDLGGWQSAVWYNNENWPLVLASYYPIYSFDPACTYGDKLSQQSAMVHEGIHSVLAEMPGCKNAAWFHEGGNTWLQQEAMSRQSGDYSSMGFLNGTTFLAPFMPIECYSGWLQDGSFGGPSAEGVNMFDGSQQLCTWRTYLGGNQYGNAFPTFLGMTLGAGSIPWIWRNCPSRVLEGMAAGLGSAQTRRLISEYRAKQALIDMGPWSNAFKDLLDANFGRSIIAEWQPSWLNPAAWTATPYAITTNNGSGLLTPENRTTPGWSGANQIPLTVTGSLVTVNFQPIGANMTCQLCYRATDGSAIYSTIVSSGNCSLRLDKAAANNVVIAVITNTDYVYNGESTRTAHYDYRLQLVAGTSGAASVNTKWYQFANLNKSAKVSDDAASKFIDVSPYCSHGYGEHKITYQETEASISGESELLVKVYPNPLSAGDKLQIECISELSEVASLRIFNIQGKLVLEKLVHGNQAIDTEGKLNRGVYLVQVQTGSKKYATKITVE